MHAVRMVWQSNKDRNPNLNENRKRERFNDILNYEFSKEHAE